MVSSCKELGGEVEIPERVEGLLVKSVGDYGFSGKPLEELRLPRSLERIGRYAFYRCFRLRSLSFSDGLRDIGAGAFTGCSPGELRIDFYGGRRSALKFILDEISGLIRATLCYHGEAGEEKARLIFPEHYEEAVENTPARLLETHHHGSGNDYRQCFYNKELIPEDYDALFPRARAKESEETAAELAALRLCYPYRLSKEAKESYEGYLREHIERAGELFTSREDKELLRFLAQGGYLTREAFEVCVDTASREGRTELLSFLMEQKNQRFRGKKKVFEL